MSDSLADFFTALRMADTNDAENLQTFFRKFAADYASARQTRAATTPHFDMLRVFGLQLAELRHSDALAWFLNPTMEHEQGVLFANTFLRLFSEVQLSHENYEVKRERHGRIDVSIYARGQFAVFIENKVRHTERDGQVEDMIDNMTSLCKDLEIPREHRFAIFLTDLGVNPVSGPKKNTEEFLLANLHSIARVDLFEAFREALFQQKNHSAILISFLDSYLYSIRRIRTQLS